MKKKKKNKITTSENKKHDWIKSLALAVIVAIVTTAINQFIWLKQKEYEDRHQWYNKQLEMIELLTTDTLSLISNKLYTTNYKYKVLVSSSEKEYNNMNEEERLEFWLLLENSNPQLYQKTLLYDELHLSVRSKLVMTQVLFGENVRNEVINFQSFLSKEPEQYIFDNEGKTTEELVNIINEDGNKALERLVNAMMKNLKVKK